MSILTKEYLATTRSRVERGMLPAPGLITDLLDTIDAMEEYGEYLKESHKETHLGLLRARDELTDKLDALEAERDALKTDLHLCQKTSSSLHAQVDRMAGMTGRIKSIAKTNQNTHTIAWSQAALREILAVIEGNESDNSIRRVTCKCINGGETTINWRTGCGETLCHAELIEEIPDAE